jgi:hypothetical protein
LSFEPPSSSILDALFKTLERQGGRVKQDDRKDLYVEVAGERVDFQLREKLKQTRRPLTDDEKRWRSSTDRDWKNELQPSGRLVFVIKPWHSTGLKTEWLENDSTPIEVMLPDIASVLIASGPLLVEARRRRDEEQRQRQIAEQRRYEEEQRRKLEQNRWRRFVEIAEKWQETRLAREFLEALKRLELDPAQAIAGKSPVDWIAWAEARLLDADPLSYGAEGTFEDVAQVTTWTYR